MFRSSLFPFCMQEREGREGSTLLIYCLIRDNILRVRTSNILSLVQFSLVPRPFLYGRGERLAPPIQEGSGNQTRSVVCQLLQRGVAYATGAGTIELKVRSGVFPSATMSTKEIKAHLKAAKAAVGRKDFQEVERICQVQQANLLIA